MEKNNSKQLGVENSPGRTEVKFYHPSKAGRNKNNKIQFSKAERCSEIGVEELLRKQAIEKVPFSQWEKGFYSNFFIVNKKDGSFRPILNLKLLNQHLEVPHFKMESL